ncbi:hypothetical protein AD949_02115 [Acetobacter orleanensis]|nr:hypothetical protein AD949_02115 [Acetobacter orleanensis]PCD78450.1 hypothetical protein CO710_12220 [Acetobacter orleanensis]
MRFLPNMILMFLFSRLLIKNFLLIKIFLKLPIILISMGSSSLYFMIRKTSFEKVLAFPLVELVKHRQRRKLKDF